MGKKIALGVVVVLVLAIAGLLAVASGQPDTFAISRSRQIAATPEALWPHLADFAKWQAWSPWAKLDPDQTTTVTGTAASVGHKSVWSGNSDVGKGQMVVTKVDAPRELGIDLTFLEPIEANNTTTFVLTRSGDKTTVQWQMTGQNNLASKVMGVLMDMDAMVGKDFEEGLANLDAVVTGQKADD